VLLSVSSFAFAFADSALALGAARFVQGIASTATWAGALAWISVVAPRERRGEVIGTAFGVAIFGAILGPVFGGLAELVSIELAFVVVGAVVLAFAGLASLGEPAQRESTSFAGLGRALRDQRFVGGLWLNMLPAMLFGLLIVLTPLALDDAGWGTFAIAAVFFGAGLVEVVLNPLLGRYTDRVGRLLPVRAALIASTVVALGLAVSSTAALIAALVCAASISFGSLYTPGMSLTSHRAESAGLAQGLAFGVMNTAWAFGELVGPTVGGTLAESAGDAVPYAVGACLCALTLAATYRITGRVSPRAA
jgi:MFS family permease